jgi:hypothetical protein
MKKLAAILLCLGMMLSLASCASCAVGSDDGIPAGMQIASVAGADYYLYVPTTWNLNTQYGISGAYYSLAKLSNVSMEKYTLDDTQRAAMQEAALEDSASARIKWYYNSFCRPVIDQLAVSGSVIEIDAGSVTTLDGANAVQFELKAEINGSTTRSYQAVAERAGAYYVFSFLAEEELVEMLMPDVQKMLTSFRFSDTPYQPEAVKVPDSDVEAPAGMKLASNSDVAYLFFVPESWVINQNEQIYAAYVEEDRASVSVVPYMPDAESMSIAEFSKMTKDKLVEIVGESGYAADSESEASLGGRMAVAHRYRLTIDGKTYEYLQVVAAYKSMIYSVTYTAPSQEIFDKHIQEVEAIIGAFSFR